MVYKNWYVSIIYLSFGPLKFLARKIKNQTLNYFSPLTKLKTNYPKNPTRTIKANEKRKLGFYRNKIKFNQLSVR